MVGITSSDVGLHRGEEVCSRPTDMHSCSRRTAMQPMCNGATNVHMQPAASCFMYCHKRAPEIAMQPIRAKYSVPRWRCMHYVQSTVSRLAMQPLLTMQPMRATYNLPRWRCGHYVRCRRLHRC